MQNIFVQIGYYISLNLKMYLSKVQILCPSPKMRVRKRGRGGTKGRHATSSLGASEFTYGTHPPTQEEEEEKKEDKMVPTHSPTLQDHLSNTLAFQYTPTHQPSSLSSLQTPSVLLNPTNKPISNSRGPHFCFSRLCIQNNYNNCIHVCCV